MCYIPNTLLNNEEYKENSTLLGRSRLGHAFAYNLTLSQEF